LAWQADALSVYLSLTVGEHSPVDSEDQIIQSVLDGASGNKTLDARCKYLGINRWMLDRRRKK